MALNNLFISYDLHKPDDNYEQVIAQIKAVGSWAKVEYSLWFVSTNSSAQSATEAVWAVMHPKDKLIVIDAASNSASWRGLSDEVSTFIRQKWAQNHR